MADEYRIYHDLQCPARELAVPDEFVAQECRCPDDGRWLNPRAKPVPEPEPEISAGIMTVPPLFPGEDKGGDTDAR